jgi:hypothetical protein
VEDNRYVVGGGVHVGLDVPETELDRASEGIGRVLVALGGATAVRESERLRIVQERVIH